MFTIVLPQNPTSEELLKTGTTEAGNRLKSNPCAKFCGGTDNGLKALKSRGFAADPNMDASGRPHAELKPHRTDVSVNSNYVPPYAGGGVTRDGEAHTFLLVDPGNLAN